MNSPGHRANILNTSYQEVGFGVVNAPNYQSSGPQTIVVAMYAKPYAAAAPVATPAPAPAPTPVAVAKPSPTPAPAPVATAEPEPAPVAETPATPVEGPAPTDTDTVTPENTTKSPITTENTISTPVPTNEVSRVEVLTAANVAWGQFAVSMLASLALLIFLLRHSFAWHKVLIKGEKFFIKHPLLDIAFVAIATAGFLLAQTTGMIR
jgi:hypothetical protein